MSAGEWVFEGPDPEVGIFGDLIVHLCDENLDDEAEAILTSQSLTTSPDGRHVNEVILFTCPACQATTTAVESHPASMFADPGR